MFIRSSVARARSLALPSLARLTDLDRVNKDALKEIFRLLGLDKRELPVVKPDHGVDEGGEREQNIESGSEYGDEVLRVAEPLDKAFHDGEELVEREVMDVEGEQDKAGRV